MQGAIEAGKEAEKIYIKDMNINYCSGCSYIAKQSCLNNALQRMQKSQLITSASSFFLKTLFRGDLW